MDWVILVILCLASIAIGFGWAWLVGKYWNKTTRRRKMDRIVETTPPTIKGDNGEDIPADGRKLLREDYPLLYTTLTEEYGYVLDETDTEFCVPDFRGRVIEWKTGDPTEQ